MKAKDSTENKGYAFVTFKTKELASKAIEELNNTEFKVDILHVSHNTFFMDVMNSYCMRNQSFIEREG